MKMHTDSDQAPSEYCAPTAEEVAAFRKAVAMIVGKWKIDIIWALMAGPKRFGELRSALPGITQHMLTSQLRALEADRLITRTAYAEIPPRVEYALTPAAYALENVFKAMISWVGETTSVDRGTLGETEARIVE